MRGDHLVLTGPLPAVERSVPVVQHMIELARLRARIRADLDIEICARAILRLSEEAGRMVLADPERFSPERFRQRLQAVLERRWQGHQRRLRRCASGVSDREGW